jgi:chromosome segregation ATPase
MSTRSAEVFAACDRIAADAVAGGEKATKPTVSLVRKYGCTVGNQTDVQNDIHDWYLKLFEGYVDNKRIPDIPPALSQAFTAVWREAMSAATSTFDAERQSLEARERIATAECEAAVELKDETARQLETAEASVIDLKQQVSELNDAVAARNERIQALIVANVENELKHTQALAEVVKDNTEQVAALNSKLQDAILVRNAAMEHLDSAKRENIRLNGEIEATKENVAARDAELKLLRDKLTTETTRAYTLATEKSAWERKFEAEHEKVEELEGARDDLLVVRTQLADLQPRLSAAESKLTDSIGTIALLDRDLSTATEKFSEAVVDNASLSHQVTVLNDAVEQKTAAIAALEAKVADLESRNKA